MAETPIGKANIELGADTTKLDAGLSAAKAKTVAAVADTEKAVASKQSSASVETPAVSTEKAAKAAEKLANNTRQAGSEASAASIKFAQLKAGMLALVGAATQLWDGIKGARAAGEDFGRSMASIEAAFRTDIAKSNDLLTSRREEIRRIAKEQNEALDLEIRQRNIIQDIVAAATDDAEEQARRIKIADETRLAMNRLPQLKEQETERLRVEANAQLQNLAARRNLERMKAEDAAMIRVAAETEANRLIEEDRVRRAAASMQELARMQQAQFSQLRNDINGLFNTSGLEVGINRVGALIQTLIDKVGDNR